jgi:hypothetical protein
LYPPSAVEGNDERVVCLICVEVKESADTVDCGCTGSSEMSTSKEGGDTDSVSSEAFVGGSDADDMVESRGGIDAGIDEAVLLVVVYSLQNDMISFSTKKSDTDARLSLAS